MRSSVADYEVIRALPASGAALSRYLCRAPERFGFEDPVMVSELAVGPSDWRELTARLSLLAQVPSPQLLGLLEVGPDLDPAGAGGYLASEAPPGGTAAEISRSEEHLLIAAVADAARGADALHDAGVAHGSIDAGCILFTRRGPVLGPPALDGPAGLVVRARSWKDVATLDPDLIRGDPPSRGSDVWALAATLYGLLTDRPLYPDVPADGSEPVVTTVQRVLFTRPEVDPALRSDLADVLSSCFAADPAERPATAGQLADELSGLVR